MIAPAWEIVEEIRRNATGKTAVRMPQNVRQKLINAHRISSKQDAGKEPVETVCGLKVVIDESVERIQLI